MTDISKHGYDALVTLRDRCEERIAQLLQKAAADIRASLEAQAAKPGLSLKEIVGNGRRRRNGKADEHGEDWKQ